MTLGSALLQQDSVPACKAVTSSSSDILLVDKTTWFAVMAVMSFLTASMASPILGGAAVGMLGSAPLTASTMS